MDVWSARRSVEKNRRAFYSVAAGILKQIEKWPAIKSAFPFSMTSPNLLQNARADLTNFVLDGTLPQNIPNGLNTKQFSIYVQNIYTIGTAILKANNHEVQLNTTNNYIELLKKLMPKENVKHEPKFIVTPNN